MTLHITTITPNHIICVSDRLLSRSSQSGSEFIEVSRDANKQFVFIADNARMVICFAGFAGTGTNPNQTFQWLIKVIGDTSAGGVHTVRKHLLNIVAAANEYISNYRKQGFPDESLGLAIFATGWARSKQYGETQYNCVIDNCIDKDHMYSVKARHEFALREELFGDKKFKDGCYIKFLGNERLGQGQTALLQVLRKHAKAENVNMIYDSSVEVIRAAAHVSEGTIGYNCVGTRSSRGDLNLEGFDNLVDGIHHRTPGIIYSTSAFSMSVTDIKLTKG